MLIENLKYSVAAYLKDGTTLDLTPAIESLSWQELGDEIAQRATLSLASHKTARGNLNELLTLCTHIRIYANGREVFRGTVWDDEYACGEKKSMTLTCYDAFIYCQNSSFDAYYPAGKSTRDIVYDICRKAGIKLKYTYSSISHAKIVYRNRTLSDQILETLAEAKGKLKLDPIARFEKETLCIMHRGENREVYSFKTRENVLSTSDRRTMDGLVTQVIILGKEDKEGRRKIEETLRRNTQFGVLQNIVCRDGDNTPEKARDEANKILDERSKPKRTMNIEAPDIPWIRKGDRVHIVAGTLGGYFHVKGITHNADSRTMSMELYG